MPVAGCGAIQGSLDWILPRNTRSGRSAAWLARLVRDQEVEGSNPFAPTTSFTEVCVSLKDTGHRRLSRYGLKPDGRQQNTSDRCADQRTQYRDGRIAPIGATLASNRQQSVRDARPQVASGIDRVAGGAAERQANSPDQTCDQVG